MDKGPYTTIKEGMDALQNHFVGADAYRMYDRKFRQVVQGNNETVAHYLFKFTEIIHCVNALAPTPEDKVSARDQLNTFMDGLNDDIQTYTCIQTVKTLAKGIELAQRAENSLKRTRKLASKNNHNSQNKKRKHGEGNHIKKSSKWCASCKMSNHTDDTCFKQHPELHKSKKHKSEVAAIDARPQLPVKINGSDVSALLDTASTESILSKQLNLFA